MRYLLLAIAAALPQLGAAAPKEVPLAGSETAVAPDGRPIVDYAAAANAIVWVLTRKLQLPVPRYMMEIYPVRPEFEAALVEHLKLKPEVAHSAGGFAKAAVGNRRVLVNEVAMAGDGWPERLVTLSHEMVHASQLELAGHRSLVRNQWLVEGFAEWTAFRVAQELGVSDLGAARESMIAKVRAVRRAGGLAPLAQMDSFEQWIVARKERGFDAMYPYSFLVLEFLVERHSYRQVLDYFRRHRESGDAAANFSAAFGESVAQFQVALDRHCATLLD
jgi:hypothetical protein